jgi:hypothetical protein
MALHHNRLYRRGNLKRKSWLVMERKCFWVTPKRRVSMSKVLDGSLNLIPKDEQKKAKE